VNKRQGQSVVLLAVVAGLLNIPAWAQQASGQKEPIPRPQNVEESSSSGAENEKVVLSPWRVGSAEGEKRKRELKKRQKRVLREAKKRQRDIEWRKKKAAQRAKKRKKEPNHFFPTHY